MMKNNSLRLYTFVNMYLSSIQQGIQTAHVVSELSSKYRGQRTAAAKLLRSWEDYGKTIIVLNGGMASDVYDGYCQCQQVWDRALKLKYPWAHFDEEAGALHPDETGATTAWGIVIPPEVYNAKPVEAFPSRVGFSTLSADEIKSTTPIWEPGSAEHYICTYLQGKGLAR